MAGLPTVPDTKALQNRVHLTSRTAHPKGVNLFVSPRVHEVFADFMCGDVIGCIRFDSDKKRA